MTPCELKELIDGCCNNNRTAQEKLYMHFYAAMFKTCLRYTDDEHNALTILNDAFLKVFKNIRRYDSGVGSFKPWLKTIVINTAIDHIRAGKASTASIHIGCIEDIGEQDPVLATTWKQEEIKCHLKLLPQITRLVVNLFAFDGYTHKDIARQLNITETTSRWHLSQARKRLRVSMNLKGNNKEKYV